MAWSLRADGEAIEDIEKWLFAEVQKLLHRAELGPVSVSFEGNSIAGNSKSAGPASPAIGPQPAPEPVA